MRLGTKVLADKERHLVIDCAKGIFYKYVRYLLEPALELLNWLSGEFQKKKVERVHCGKK